MVFVYISINLPKLFLTFIPVVRVHFLVNSLLSLRFEQSISEGARAGPSVAPTVQPHPHWVPSSAVHAAKPQKPAKPPSQATLLKNAIAAHMEKNSVQTMASEAMMRVKQDLKFKRKTVAPDKAKLRCAGGQVWYDPSLEDWDSSECFYILYRKTGNFGILLKFDSKILTKETLTKF